jgi:hypothetical protein
MAMGRGPGYPFASGPTLPSCRRVEAKVKEQQAVQLAQPSVPATVPTPDASSPAEPPVRDVVASTVADDIDKVRLCNFNCASIDADPA